MMIAMKLASGDHPEQAVLEFRPRFEIGPPVAGVHVADADQKRRPGERL